MLKVTMCGLFDSKTVYPNKEYSSPRVSKRYELELFLEDGGTAFADGKAYPIRKGWCALFPPGSHRYSHLHFRSLFVHFCAEEEEEAAQIIGQLPTYMKLFHTEEYETLFRTIIDHFHSPSFGSELFLCAKLCELLYRLCCHAKIYTQLLQEGSEPTEQEAILSGKRYIDRNFTADISLEQIAQSARLSACYFHRRFTKAFGQTPRQYLTQKRIALAKQMLVFGEESLVEIALACGFTSQSYFNYIFRRETGQSPGQYRRRIAKENSEVF